MVGLPKLPKFATVVNVWVFLIHLPVKALSARGHHLPPVHHPIGFLHILGVPFVELFDEFGGVALLSGQVTRIDVGDENAVPIKGDEVYKGYNAGILLVVIAAWVADRFVHQLFALYRTPCFRMLFRSAKSEPLGLPLVVLKGGGHFSKGDPRLFQARNP